MAGKTEILDLADGGGVIVISPGGEKQVVKLPLPNDSARKTRAKRALGAFLHGMKSPFLQPDGNGNQRMMVA